MNGDPVQSNVRTYRNERELGRESQVVQCHVSVAVAGAVPEVSVATQHQGGGV